MNSNYLLHPIVRLGLRVPPGGGGGTAAVVRPPEPERERFQMYVPLDLEMARGRRTPLSELARGAAWRRAAGPRVEEARSPRVAVPVRICRTVLGYPYLHISI